MRCRAAYRRESPSWRRRSRTPRRREPSTVRCSWPIWARRISWPAAGGDAVAVAQRALDLAHRQKERGNEAWVLRLLGDIAARADPPDSEAAAGYYARALARASELEMRPLIAHCHLGLAALHQGGGDHAKGQEHLRTAATLYRGMDMGSWLEKAETKLGSVLGTQL